MYAEEALPFHPEIRKAHTKAVEFYTKTGTWFSGVERAQILTELRHARGGNCELCRSRKEALSPYATSGSHDQVTSLAEPVVEVIHRIVTDSGRLTEKWFREITSGALSQEEYIEIVGLIALAFVLDSFAVGVGEEQLNPTGKPEATEPTREKNTQVIDGGAWVPLLDVEYKALISGIPEVPNIARAMGLVPRGLGEFFSTMSAHYHLAELSNTDLTRPQIELVASRVSACNDCFY